MSKKRTNHDYKTLAYLLLVAQAALLVVALCITVIFLAPNNFKMKYAAYKKCRTTLVRYNPAISKAEIESRCRKPR